MTELEYDYIIIGSGFGGSVSALRLAEKGYRVLVIEKGRRFAPTQFPENNWQLKKWLWAPGLGLRGLFQISLFRHITVFSGVGVGGGSLVYANTLPTPTDAFFKAASWAHLADWKAELAPHYDTALKMLGAAENPILHQGDHALKAVAQDLGIADRFAPTRVGVFFGKANQTVPDPYFNGKGPERTGCNHCGACMLGCPNNSKNTLDKNYLYLAEQLGVKILAESEVIDVQPLADAPDGAKGYLIKWRDTIHKTNGKKNATTQSVIFAGGVLGTMDLLLKLKKKSLPRLSNRLGYGIRTNSESLLGTTTFDKNKVLSHGIAISSILHTDPHTHLEVVRYKEGSGFFRLGMTPAVMGSNFFSRMGRMFWDYVKDPLGNFKGFFIDDWSKRSQILLFMQTLDSTLRMKKNWFGGLSTEIEHGNAPTPFIQQAHDLAHRFAQKITGKAFALVTETALGIPSTAHILGGACMGKDATEGVIDKNNRVFGYENMFVCDGSMISANPGVNPSLTITALAERAMQQIPPKQRT